VLGARVGPAVLDEQDAQRVLHEQALAVLLSPSAFGQDSKRPVSPTDPCT